MTDVNPELIDESILKLRDRVRALFGSRSDALVKSVAQFMRSDPGSLDHQNLRVIAAAAPHMRDPALVAKLVDDLPITRMHVGAVPLDLESDRRRLGVVFSKFSNRARTRLTADLVRRNTIDTITFCPPETVTEEGRKLIEAHLLSLANGNPDQQELAVASPFTTPEVIDAVLDNVQRRIERSERGTSNREPQRLPGHLAIRSLASVVDKNSTATTPQHVTRAWSLANRCKVMRSDVGFLVQQIVEGSKLEEETAHSILDVIERMPSSPDLYRTISERLCNTLISIPELPVTAVRRAVVGARGQPGQTFNVHFNNAAIIDRKWHFFRTEIYTHGFDGMSTEAPTSEEVDRWIARRPPETLRRIDRRVVEEMTDPDALEELGKRVFDGGPTLFELVCDNPHTPKKMFVDLLATMSERAGSLPPDTLLDRKTSNERKALCDRRLSDEDIANYLEQEMSGNYLFPLHFTEMLELVASNPSSGRRVFQYIRENQPDPILFERFASSSPNPEIHRLLADVVHEADQPGDQFSGRQIGEVHASTIRDWLVDNGTVSTDIANELRIERIPTVHSPQHLYTYGPRDVAARLIEERSENDPQVDLLIGLLTQSSTATSALSNEAVQALRSMADAGLLNTEHWRRLTSHTDRHIAMEFATHPRCDGNSSALETVAGSLLQVTTRAVEARAALPDREPRDWSDLPDESDKPFELSPAAILIDNQTVGGLKLEVPKTPRALDQLAQEMGNCLSFYKDAVANGTEVVAAARDAAAGDIYAVAWDANTHSSSPQMTISQINSKHNRGRVPDAFEAGVRMLTDKMNRGELPPAVKEAPVVEQDVSVREARTELQTVRRPAARRQPLELVADQPQQVDPRQQRQEGQSLLANGAGAIERATPELEQGPNEGIDPPALDLEGSPYDGQDHTSQLEL